MYKYENRDKMRKHQQRKASLSNSPFTNKMIYGSEPFLPPLKKGKSKSSLRKQQRYDHTEIIDPSKRLLQTSFSESNLVAPGGRTRYDPMTGKFVSTERPTPVQKVVGIASNEEDFTVPLRSASDAQIIAELARRKLEPSWVSVDRLLLIATLVEVCCF
jgi:hypothetical protein